MHCRSPVPKCSKVPKYTSAPVMSHLRPSQLSDKDGRSLSTWLGVEGGRSTIVPDTGEDFCLSRELWPAQVSLMAQEVPFPGRSGPKNGPHDKVRGQELKWKH